MTEWALAHRLQGGRGGRQQSGAERSKGLACSCGSGGPDPCTLLLDAHPWFTCVQSGYKAELWEQEQPKQRGPTARWSGASCRMAGKES